MTGLYDELRSAAAFQDDRALIRVRTVYESAGGQGARIYPPTYPASPGESPYVVESKIVNGEVREDVLLDSVPSQANRAEEALLRAHTEGRVRLPLLQIDHQGAAPLRLTSLELPHRYADAYLIDSRIDGIAFDKTEIGKAFLAASSADASMLLRYDPGSLVFGAWNSHRKGRQAKFPRIYASELVGWDPQIGDRKAGRMDPLNLVGAGSRGPDGELAFSPTGEKVKGERLSELGLGNIAPNRSHGGVTVSSAERVATVSLAGLARLGFGDVPAEAALAARVLLAAYALMADRLAFGGPSLWLRSGCELVTVDESLQWVARGGQVEPINLTTTEAVDLYDAAFDEAVGCGLGPDLNPVILQPGPGLAKAIDFALTKADTAGD